VYNANAIDAIYASQTCLRRLPFSTLSAVKVAIKVSAVSSM
jgi:hypothetical protein